MILAQHADKTWGDICEIFGVKANEVDKDIKLCESRVLSSCIGFCSVAIDHEHSGNFLILFDKFEHKSEFVCFGEFDYGKTYTEIEVKDLLSLISFEDKV